MREVICINVGQAGVQMSNAAWELFCLEHGIEENGTKKQLPHMFDEGTNTFFEEVPNGNFVPRAINIDLEPTVIDEIRTTSYRDLWHPDYLINSNEDAANNFARGHFTAGRRIIKRFMDNLRKCVHKAECLQGFIILNSYGGGTGSGLSALILENLLAEFSKKSKFQKCIFPAPKLSTAVVEPFNALLTSSKTIESTDLVSLIDNEAVYDICSDNLNIPRPAYSNINRLVAQIFSAMTVSIRFGSSLDHNLGQLRTNLVPFPRIHFPTTNYAPIVSNHSATHERLSIIDLTKNVFEPRNQLVKISMWDGKYIACSMQYRGLITPSQVNLAIREMKRRTDIQFVEWCPTGFKLGISPMPPVIVPRSELGSTKRNCSMYANNTAISQLFNRLSMKFDLLFKKRAFIHWYLGEGMEEGEFIEHRDILEQIKNDYYEISKPVKINSESNNSYSKSIFVKRSETKSFSNRYYKTKKFIRPEDPLNSFNQIASLESVTIKSSRYNVDETNCLDSYNDMNVRILQPLIEGGYAGVQSITNTVNENSRKKSKHHKKSKHKKRHEKYD